MQPLPGWSLSQFASVSGAGTYPVGNSDRFASPVGTRAYSVGNVQQPPHFGPSFPAPQSQFSLSFPAATAPTALAAAQSVVYGGLTSDSAVLSEMYGGLPYQSIGLADSATVYGVLPYQSTGLADSSSTLQSQTSVVYDSCLSSQGGQGSLHGAVAGALVSTQTFSSVASSAWPSSQTAPSMTPIMPGQHSLQSRFPAPSASKFGRTVIFLDVDGVLHSTSAAVDAKFSPSCMQALARIVRTTGADIVLSSSWRTSEGAIGQVNGALSSYGLKAVIGCTAITTDAREKEICQWLDKHSAEVARWLAIDDINLAGNNVLCDSAKRMREHFIHTNPNTGLTEADASKAVALIAKQ